MEEVIGVQNMVNKPVPPPPVGKPENSKQPDDSDELHLKDCDIYLTTDTTNTDKEIDTGEYSYVVAHPEPRYLYENV